MKKNLIFIFLILLLAKAAQAAGGAHGDGVPIQVLYQAINVTILISLLYFLTRKKVAAYLIGRVETHEQAKQQAQKAVVDAEERHKEVSSKLKTLQETEEQMIERARNEALEMKSKLIQEAEALSRRMIEEARKTTTYEQEKAKQVLREEAFDMAMKQAKQAIEKNLTSNDHKNLQKQFVDSIGAAR